jgi:AraC-like DNA-binding protein
MAFPSEPAAASSELPHSAASVDALLELPCRCHGTRSALRPRAPARAGAVRLHDPQLPMRTFRPLLRHVRVRLPSHSDRLAQWDQLDDEDLVSAQAADAWLVEASRWLRDPLLGLNALTALMRGAGDVVELAAECAATLGEALSTLTRYAHLVYEAADFHLRSNARHTALELHYTVPVSHLTSDYVAGLLVHGLRQWLGSIAGVQLWFKDAGARRTAAYEAAFAPVSAHFGTSVDALVFPSALLDTPLRGADPIRHRVLLRFAESLAGTQRETGALSDQVRRLLVAALSSNHGKAHGVARKLGMSQRTLARALQREGHTFSDLLDEVRRERALHLVEHSGLPSYRIAQILGYGSSATFCRAFARWQGQSPLHHRRNQN